PAAAVRPGLAGEHGHLTGPAVDHHPGVGGPGLVVVIRLVLDAGVLVGLEQRGLDRLDQGLEGEVVLPLDAAQLGDADFHRSVSSPGLPPTSSRPPPARTRWAPARSSSPRWSSCWSPPWSGSASFSSRPSTQPSSAHSSSSSSANSRPA